MHAITPAARTCTIEAPPTTSSPAAIAYIDAVNKQIPARQRLNNVLASEGNLTHRDDLATETSIDTDFLADLRAIDFPRQARPAAAALENDFTDYISLLRVSYADTGYLAAHADLAGQLDESRAEDAAALRVDLGLPPSNCVLRRP